MSSQTTAPTGVTAADSPAKGGQVELKDIGSKPLLPIEEDLMQLARLGEVGAIQKLFDGGKFTAKYLDEQGISPLHWAAINNHYALCHFLIQQGADVNAKGGDADATPVLWAAKKCHYYVVDLLLKNGADPLLADGQGFNLLHSATVDGNVFQIALLLHEDIAIDVPDAQGQTSLMWAAYKGYPQCVDLLLNWGANVYARDSQGFTALHWALVKGQQHIIFKLVEYGSDRFAETNNGKTPAIVAKEMNSARQWHLALAECGYNPDGSSRNFPLASIVKDRRYFYTRFFFLWPFFVIIVALYIISHIVIYAAVPLTFLTVYTLQWSAQKLLKWAPTDMKTMQKTPFLSGVFAGTLFWVGVRWATTVLPYTWNTMMLGNFIFAGLYGLCTFFFFKTMVEDPGYVVKASGRAEQKAVVDELLEQRKFDDINYCVTCMVRRPLRSKHCKRCQRCVGKQDHHCPWVDNCIGVNNHRHFVLYVVTMAIGVVIYDLVILNYLELLPRPTNVSCNILSSELCQILNADPFTISLSIWASLQLVWVSMLVIVQLVQVARGLTTYESMTQHHRKHGAGEAFTSFVTSGTTNMDAAGLTSGGRGPDPAVLPPPARPVKHGCLNTWKRMLGIDTFLATALFGSRAAEAQAQSRKNPFSRGLVQNLRDFCCDPAPLFGSRVNGEAILDGQRVDYTRLYEVPARRRRGGGNAGYEAVHTGEGGGEDNV